MPERRARKRLETEKPGRRARSEAAPLAPAPEPAPLLFPLPHQRSLAMKSIGEGAILTVRAPGGNLEAELEIRITPDGTVVRARAAGLELETEGPITARCEDFRVEARGRIDLVATEGISQRTGGTMEIDGARVGIQASPGAVRVQANDDVQLLGEQVLLNCDRQPPPPAWVPRLDPPPEPEKKLPLEPISGDAALAAEVPPEDGQRPNG